MAPNITTFQLAEIASNYKREFLELGTGSGYITIYLINKGLKGIATEISDKAIECSNNNFNIFNIQLKTIKSDLYSNVEGKYNLIVFNPPTGGNESEFDRKVKNFFRTKLPFIYLLLEKPYFYLNRNKIAKFMINLINETKDHLNPNGVLLVSIPKLDFKYLKTKIVADKFTITNKGENEVSNIIEVKYENSINTS